MTTRVYFFGTDDGKTVKIGSTGDTLKKRREGLLRGQLSAVKLYLLAAVNGTGTNEGELKKFFAHLKDDYNSTESFHANQELVEYINWLRQQWWVYLEEADVVDETPAWTEWRPTETRRVAFVDEDPFAVGELIPRNVTYVGPLAGTKWNWLSTPSPKLGEDFYTPKYLVDAARTAMGGIDLDPASHWMANRVHRIPLYYHNERRAEDNPWFGRVWLNPPYPGKGSAKADGNKLWFSQIIKYRDSGDLQQLCMISPMWAFTTEIARPIMQRASALIVCAPTPEFWGNPDGRTGTNHPHAIIYIGDRSDDFNAVFSRYGIPCELKLPATWSAAAA